MNDIVQLDERTIAKIAAGEVVERPASVVKELVENSIDAGATSVAVEVMGGGVDEIRVIDNGRGMQPSEVEIAVQRHTTSKISSFDDLSTVLTLGFRGEALASIAAVSIMEITSRMHDDGSTGTWTKLEGGKIAGHKEIGATPGTGIWVRKLFYNTPARRKFLKSAEVELEHVKDIVNRLAFGRPDIRFRLISNGVPILDAPPTPDLLERIAQIWSARTAKRMMPVDHGSGGVRVVGLTGEPDLTRSNGKMVMTFVNGRYVRSRNLLDTIKRAYRPMLMRNRFPVCVIDIRTEPTTVDINIHPTKMEVKFSREKEVLEAMTAAIVSAIGSVPRIPEYKEITSSTPASPGPAPVEEEPATPSSGPREGGVQTTLGTTRTSRMIPGERLPPLRPVGQLLNTYILCEGNDGLYIIDQHAAHERVMLARLQERMAAGMRSQELLSPVLVELEREHGLWLLEHQQSLSKLGFALEPFGETDFLIRSIPPELSGKDVGPIMTEMVEELMSTHGHRGRDRPEELDSLAEAVLSSVACHSAIRANEPLTIERMERLIIEMNSLDQPFACAHGRPTVVKMTAAEIEKLFKRRA